MPLISDSQKFVFVHVPKTAGTSISKVLGKYVERHNYENWYLKNDHITLSNLSKHLDLGGYYKFAVVRNPYDLMLSLWCYKRKHPNQYLSKEAAALGFIEFVRFIYENREESFFETYEIFPLFRGGQWNWIDCGVNKIMRFENLEFDFQTILSDLGLPQEPLPRLNVTNHSCYLDYYDKVAMRMVEAIFSMDFDHLYPREIAL